MPRFEEHPSQGIGTRGAILRPEPPLALAQPDKDRIRFPEDKTLVVRDGYLLHGVEGGEFRLSLVAMEQIDFHNLGRQLQLLQGKQNLLRVGGPRAVNFHELSPSEWVRNSLRVSDNLRIGNWMSTKFDLLESSK